MLSANEFFHQIIFKRNKLFARSDTLSFGQDYTNDIYDIFTDMMDIIQVTDITNITDITDKQMYNKWEKVQIKYMMFIIDMTCVGRL